MDRRAKNIKYPSLLLLLLFFVTTSWSCSIICPPGERVCSTGGLGADCSGFQGCRSPTEPCGGECPADHPVLSWDGRCHQCQSPPPGSAGAGLICPTCEDEEYFCIFTMTCQHKTLPCGAKCPLARFPKMNADGTECEECPSATKWCPEENRCHDPSMGEPCHETCYSVYGRLGSYCPETGWCQSQFFPCGGQCIPDSDSQDSDWGLRYCGRIRRPGPGEKRGPGLPLDCLDREEGDCCIREKYYDRWCEDFGGGFEYGSDYRGMVVVPGRFNNDTNNETIILPVVSPTDDGGWWWNRN